MQEGKYRFITILADVSFRPIAVICRRRPEVGLQREADVGIGGAAGLAPGCCADVQRSALIERLLGLPFWPQKLDRISIECTRLQQRRPTRCDVQSPPRCDQLDEPGPNNIRILLDTLNEFTGLFLQDDKVLLEQQCKTEDSDLRNCRIEFRKYRFNC